MFDFNDSIAALKNKQNLVFNAPFALVSLKGSDARDFLHRMSTNNFLSTKNPLATSFVSQKGRLIDHCLVFPAVDDEFILVSSHRNADIISQWLNNFIFIEDIIIADKSSAMQFSYIISSDDADTIIHHHSSIIQCGNFSLNNGHVINIFGVLNETAQGLCIDEASFKTWRIAALMPAAPQEINDHFMPQEVNLGAFIASDKGCYIGQEVILKSLTYQKNGRRLRGLKVAPEAFFSLPDTLALEDGLKAKVTSKAPSYWPGEFNALVMVSGIGQK